MLDPKLLDLPPEIFAQILSDLTSAQCVSLSRTCKTLQPFAETRLYDSIATGPKVGYPYPIPIGVIEDRAAGNCDSWGEDWDYPRELEVLLNQVKTDFHLRVLLTSLSANPSRIPMVRHLRLFVIGDEWKAMMELLTLVRPSAESLHLEFSDNVSLENDSRLGLMNQFYRKLSELGPFPRLRSFIGEANRFEFGDFDCILELSPRLQHLHILTPEDGDKIDPDRDQISASLDFECFEGLHTIRLEHIDPDFFPDIGALVAALPSLVALAVTTWKGERNPIPVEVADVLRGKTGLRYLEWSSIYETCYFPLKVSDGTSLFARGFEDLVVLAISSSKVSPLRSIFTEVIEGMLPVLRHVLLVDPDPDYYSSLTLVEARKKYQEDYNLTADDVHTIRRLESVRSIHRSDLRRSQNPAEWRDEDSGILIKNYPCPARLDMGQLSPLTVFTRMKGGQRCRDTPSTSKIDKAFGKLQEVAYSGDIPIPLEDIRNRELWKALTGGEEELDLMMWKWIQEWLQKAGHVQ